MTAGRRASWILGVAIVVGGGLILAAPMAEAPLRDWIVRDGVPDPRRARAVLFALAALLVSPLVVFAVSLARLAGRVDGEGRFPPAGSSFVRQTLVLTGDAARRRARLLRVLAALLAFGGALLTLAIWRLSLVLAPV